MLGNVGAVDPAVVPALAEAQKDPNATVRQYAAKALERVRGEGK